MSITDRTEVVHAAVYIAADVGFTKNGSAFTRPSLLMDVQDVVAIYTGVKEGRVAVYRLKDID
jgi:hypothetical protein